MISCVTTFHPKIIEAYFATTFVWKSEEKCRTRATILSTILLIFLYPWRVNFGYNSSHFFVPVARQLRAQFFSDSRNNFEYKFVQCRFRVVAASCNSTYNNITRSRNILSRVAVLLSIAPVRSNGRQSTVVASSCCLLPRVAACFFSSCGFV